MKSTMKTETVNEINNLKSFFTTRIKQYAIILFTITATSVPATTWSTDLVLSRAPLFLDSSVQPNIFFMLDDSGSMDWEVLQSDRAMALHAGNPNSGNLDLTPDTVAERLEFCYSYNVMAYNPNVSYIPWKGVDNAGIPYGNMTTYTAVRENPYVATSATRNLNATGIIAYFPWTDANNDGQYDVGECGSTADNSAAVTFASLSPAEKTNFANWYSYYRKREYVMKAAMNEIILTSDARMGMSTLHNNNNVGIPIHDIDNISVPLNPTADANKRRLMDRIGQINSTGGTPLRRNLQDVGDYYRGTSNAPLFGGTSYTHTDTFDPQSPILNLANGGTCQQNFTVLLSDGFANGGNPIPSVGNADAQTPLRDALFDKTQFYVDRDANVNDTLADVAMFYYDIDLAPGLADLVPIKGSTATDQQRMVTYTVSFGLKGEIEQANPTVFATNKEPSLLGGSWPNWPDPFTNNDPPIGDPRIDDLWHAAYNGHGSYLNAGDPQDLIAQFRAALDHINSRTGSAAGVSVTSGTISSSTRIYQTQFKSSDWSGHLLSLRVNGVGDIVPAPDFAGGTTNEAIVAIEGQHWDTDRVILSHNGNQGIKFRWPSDPTAPTASEMSLSQVTALVDGDLTIGGTPDYTRAADRVNFLRGDHTNEMINGTGNFRNRQRDILGCTTDKCTKVPFVLGDTVNSSPLYVGAPPFGYPDYLEATTTDANRYNDFKLLHFDRTPMIYFGANDGMLHGIDANTGEEKLAYVPAKVYNNLAALTDPNYIHTYYVDESPEVADVFYNGAWHTNLIGALRGGGQGIFALDVTDPTTFTSGESTPTDIVRWEFTDDDDPDLGYTYGRPTVAKMQNGRWYVIIGNGYNNTVADGAASTSGNAVLYIIDIETKAVTKIDTGVGMTSPADTPNGLAKPAVVDYDGDYRIDYIYAGDLKGNMWKFDVTSGSPANWRNAGNRSILYTAVDNLGVAQPITSRPEIDYAPNGPKGMMVLFGTGKYLEPNDISGTQTHSMYGIWDQAGYSGDPTVEVFRNELVTQTLTTVVGITSGLPRRLDTNLPITTWGNGGGAGEYMGWKIDMPETGERVISSPVVQDRKAVFLSITPDSDPCGFGGTSWFMVFNSSNGGRTDEDVIDVNNDGVVNDQDRDGGTDIISGVKIGLVLNPELSVSDKSVSTSTGATVDEQCASASASTVITSDSEGNVVGTTLGRPQKAFRQGWRQIQ